MEQQNSYDLIKQSMGLRLDNIIQLGCKLLMYDNAYHKKPPPTDEEVRCMILSVINKSTNKNCKSKIKPYAEWTEQERIEPAVDRFNALNEESKEKFYERLTAYTRFYSFISQIIPYESCVENHRIDNLCKAMAGGLNASWQDVKSRMNDLAREWRKEPKRPRGRPRKNRPA